MRLLSFDSYSRWPLSEIERQGRQFKVFTEFSLLTPADLPKSFCADFGDYLSESVRGYGYWSWKPTIILETLAQMKENEVLLYVDSGCRLNLGGKSRFEEYLDLLDEHESGILMTQLDCPEYLWTKGDVYDFFGVRDSPAITHTGQLQAGIILVRNCVSARQILSIWKEVIASQWSLIDDSPSKSPNFPGFVENRHDQSLISIIGKQNNVPTISFLETQPAENERNWRRLKNFPIHARRARFRMRDRFRRRLFQPVAG